LLYKSLDVPPEKRHYCLERVGNSSGASLPSLLADAWREGRVRPGSRTLMCSFGGGLAWGAISIRWPIDADAAVPGSVDVGPNMSQGGT
jgi:3-oxoacyl-[acyl-carrier-protein] synthase III